MSEVLQKLSDKLKEKDLRLTKARKEIFNLLEKSLISLSPKEVFQKIEKNSKADLVSVYRNLALFSELGLAHRFQDGKYSSCSHGESHTHHSDHKHIHIINRCTRCGKSNEIKAHSQEVCHVVNELKKVSKLLKNHQEVIIQGYCFDCDK